jgi:hypothetical protein
VVDRCLGFLGLTSGFMPPNLGKRYHVGGSQPRVRWLSSGPIQRLLGRILGRSGRRLRTKLNMWNIVPESNSEFRLTEGTRQRLEEFYRPDVLKLE